MLYWAGWFIATLFYLYEFVLRISPGVMTGELMSHFHMTSTHLGFLTSAYYYAYVPLQIPSGLIVDYYGPRIVVTLSAVIASLGIALFALSHHFYVALLARFLIGMGSACAFISCLKIASLWFPKKQFGFMVGATNTMGVLSGVLAGYPLARFVSAFAWQDACLMFGAVGLVLAVLIWMLIPQAAHAEKPNAQIIAPLLSVVHNPSIWIMGLCSGMMYSAITAFSEVWAVPYIVAVYQVSREVASSINVLIFIGVAIGGLCMAYLAHKAASYLKIMKIMTLIMFALFVLVLYADCYPLWLFAIIVTGIGLALSAQVLSFGWVNDGLTHNNTGVAMGFLNTIIMLLGMILQPLIGYALDYFWQGDVYPDGARLYTASTFVKALAIIPISMLICFVLLYALKETYRNDFVMC